MISRSNAHTEFGGSGMLTGEEYKETLFDGRAIFFGGKRVDDLPAHPILGPSVQSVADGYDWCAANAGTNNSRFLSH